MKKEEYDRIHSVLVDAVGADDLDSGTGGELVPPDYVGMIISEIQDALSRNND
jgi:hypothetical protein